VAFIEHLLGRFEQRRGLLVVLGRMLLGTGHPDTALNWADIPAFEKVGLAPDVEVVELEGAQEELDGVRGLFLG